MMSIDNRLSKYNRSAYKLKKYIADVNKIKNRRNSELHLKE